MFIPESRVEISAIIIASYQKPPLLLTEQVQSVVEGVEKSRVEKFGVEKSRVEKSGVEKSGVEKSCNL